MTTAKAVQSAEAATQFTITDELLHFVDFAKMATKNYSQSEAIQVLDGLREQINKLRPRIDAREPNINLLLETLKFQKAMLELLHQLASQRGETETASGIEKLTGAMDNWLSASIGVFGTEG